MEPEHWDLAGGRFTARRARADDVAGLVALIGADPVSATRGDCATDDLAVYDEAFAAIDADPRQLLLVVTRTGGDVPIGTLQRTLVPGLGRRGGWRAQLESVHVAADARGHGLGARMVRWAVDDARRRGCVLVQLTSAVERPDAHRFYERLEFTASHVGFKLGLG